MEGLIFLLVIAGLIMKVVQSGAKKQKGETPEQARQRAAIEAARAARQREEADARRAATGRTMQPTIRPGVSSTLGGWTCRCGRENAQSARFCTKCGRARGDSVSGSMAYASAEGAASMEGAAYASTEGEGSNVRINPNPAKPKLRHVVKPVTESDHSHTEGGVAGAEPCYEGYEQPDEDAYEISTSTRALPHGLTLIGREALIRGVLYSEIIGKPKALQRR